MKAIITIAGYGTRFLPASKAVPKEMIPIAGVPLIQHHVEELVAAGITEVIVVVRGAAEAVQHHFAPTPDLERHLEAAGKLDLLQAVRRISRLADIIFVRQPESLPYGNASPALAARPWLTPGEPFYYMFGDDIILADVPVPKQMLDAFHAHRPAAAVASQTVPDEETHLYGCIAFKPGSKSEMARIVEKPAPGTAPSNWVQIGHFIFTPELFDVLDTLEPGKGGELWLADAVDRLAARSSVIVQPIEGKWLPAGDPLRHLKACIEAALRREEWQEDLVAYLRSLEL
ncbi:MAG TPA: UTP--glucose-1-phosphate uridylyltransferase [Anaerolineales bacterium]|nr:UTP--glucose-1-phosphate uridylyltransferase [Anaerolineae bacterium]HIQ00743.1 UTP--glucose-1-phosphate uridylyltransferase [Anaerolineales bacterium]